MKVQTWKWLAGPQLLVFLFLGCEGQQVLENACKINQFRCSDGSKCLSTEKLCNGRKDCPKGEDEKGSSQWDCTRITLSQPCHPQKEFRCRFGGCVPVEKICNGVPDCWGATDESTDTCTGRKRPPPPLPPTQSPPSPRPTTAQVTESATTRPRPRPPAPAPPAPRPTTPSPPEQIAQPAGSRSCPPISEHPLNGFHISCETQYGKPIGDCSGKVPIGAVARYQCAKYYKISGVGSATTARTCQENGQWTSRRQNFHCSLECGVGGEDTTALVTGGTASKKGKWPWHVALYHEDPPNSGKWDLKCGGSLITPQAVLTAAHCVTRKSSERPLPRQDIQVVVGKFHRNYNKKDNGEQVRGVRHIEVNPDFNWHSLDSDIAIIFLEEPVIVTDYVRPVCLPDEDLAYPGNEGNLVGWGRATGGGFKESLQEAKIPVVASNICKAAHQTFATLVRSTNFCAGYRNGTSACDGDSGGGLVFLDNDVGRHYNVHGIVSAGVAKSTGGGGCEDKYYAVFTKVSKFHSWISTKLDMHYEGWR